MKTRAWIALASLLCAGLAPTAPALADPSADALFQPGLEAYGQPESEQAIAALDAALGSGSLTRDQKIQAYTCLGVIYVGMNSRNEAILQFLALLRIDPDVKIEYGLRSPKVTEALREAREIYVRQMKATDTAAPVIQISPVTGKVPFGSRLDLTFRISDQNRIVQPQIFFRKAGDLTYDFLPLQPQGRDVYFVSIPGRKRHHRGQRREPPVRARGHEPGDPALVQEVVGLDPGGRGRGRRHGRGGSRHPGRRSLEHRHRDRFLRALTRCARGPGSPDPPVRTTA